MKTVVKKVAKKAPVKSVKAATKVVAKPVAKKIVKAPVKAVKKPAAKPVAMPVKKITAKPVAKQVLKTVAKSATKVVAAKSAKSVKAVKAVKAVAVPAKKTAKQAKPTKSTKPNKAEPIKAEKTSKVAKHTKTEKPAKAVKIAKAESKPAKAEEKLKEKSKQSMVIASKTVHTESKLATKTATTAVLETTPAAPVLSKARTSRLASLTVPSMAQSVASTAAKSSYGPAVHAQVFITPPQNAPKQNPKLANNWKNKTAEEMSDEELLAMPESEYMNIKQMMYFRLKLIELKKGILESAGATTEHLRDESAVVPDPTDRATIEEEHALELRTRDRERKLLKKIEQSIGRIDAGDYGYCDETGEAIGVGRLLARPTATLSLEAQQRRELKQKMFGD
jgi:DnaK suppressor protein